MNNKKSGINGENLAAEFLENKGFVILERNYSCRIGEIDIVAMDKDVLVFVEVKSRDNTRFGMPLEAITPAKVRSIIATARYYIATHKKYDLQVRFDVVAILRGKIEHIENAFEQKTGF
ncbi:MAG: YraN family protein [Christensenellales bacterium]